MYKIRVFKLKLIESSTKSVKVEKVNTGEAAAQIFSTYLKGEDRKHFVLLMLDLKKRVIGIHTICIGSLTQSVVHPREVFKVAILANAHAIIIGHNHPTGDVTPSIADLDVTRELVSAGEILRHSSFRSYHRRPRWKIYQSFGRGAYKIFSGRRFNFTVSTWKGNSKGNTRKSNNGDKKTTSLSKTKIEKIR